MSLYHWEEVISCIRAQEEHRKIPLHPEHGEGARQVDANYRAYVRLQRFLRRRCPGWSDEEKNRLRDGAFIIAREFNLNPRRTIRLIISLSQLASTHSIAKSWQSEPALSRVSRKLKAIEKSVGRVASFWSPSDKISESAAHLLTRAAADWASEQTEDQLQRFGFSRRVFSSGAIETVAYGETGVVRRWFEVAPLILQFIKRAQQELDARSRNSVAIFDEEYRAQVWLVGGQLPRLYERLTGRRFGVAKDKEGNRPLDTTGVKFVRLLLQAMGLPPISPDTVVSHWKSEKQRARANKQQNKRTGPGNQQKQTPTAKHQRTTTSSGSQQKQRLAASEQKKATPAGRPQKQTTPPAKRQK
jgi:hypothetical protein